ncbi:MAG: NAD-dependent epimerase/dehydratase family protein [Thermodesulfobacteriota bacterium]
MKQPQTILVTGGAGYVGAVLVPKLLERGYRVKVIDLYMYGEDVLGAVADHPNLTQVKGDIRDEALLERELPGTDAVIHLACISNDPSYELDPALGKSINYDAFVSLVAAAKKARSRRFIYASSSSVYGVKEEPEVTEELSLEPLTDYSLYKAKCEEVLLDAATDDFIVTIIRPSTVCGYSPRLRLDLTVNILTNHAINKGTITVFGGDQKRPNIHIEDMTDLYLVLLEQPEQKIHKQIFNAGYQNYKVMEIAEIVREALGNKIPVEVIPSNDNRSYHVSSEKIRRALGFEARRTVEEAVADLRDAFRAGKIPNPMDDIRYYNIKTMQHLKLT